MTPKGRGCGSSAAHCLAGESKAECWFYSRWKARFLEPL